jgi:uncharacterized protein YcbX
MQPRKHEKKLFLLESGLTSTRSSSSSATLTSYSRIDDGSLPVAACPIQTVFDEASISVIASDTVNQIGRFAGRSLDVRRFRPNVLVRLLRPVPFQEDEGVGGVLSFGEGDDAPAITVTMRDVRCSMVNFDQTQWPGTPPNTHWS